MDFLPKIVYQDDDLLLARKPHGIASSWGQEESFLDIIKKYGSDDRMRSHQISVFGEEGEYGLLNRLDNVTS
jgi:23S rRNA-/tRNA-specific pseudouridylate synthase